MNDATKKMDVLLTGKILPNADISQVAASLAKMARISPEQAHVVITSGKARLLWRGLTPEKSQSVKEHFTSLGIEVITRPSTPATPPVQESPKRLEEAQTNQMIPPVSAASRSASVAQETKVVQAAMETTCPKCGHRQAGDKECENCGLIFHKWKEREEQHEHKSTPRQSEGSYCTNCGKTVTPQAAACPHCGFSPFRERNFCHSCGIAIDYRQVMCVNCGTSFDSHTEKKVVVNLSNRNSISFIGAVRSCFKKYADFSGRASRSEYWYFFSFSIYNRDTCRNITICNACCHFCYW